MNAGAIVMAAGLGTRMKSERPKVLHELGGRPLLFHTLDLLLEAKVKKIVIVVSYKKEDVISAVKSHYGSSKHFIFVDQKKPLGTGHAIIVTASKFKGFTAPVFIMSGDVPLLTLKTFQTFYNHHKKNKARITIGSAMLDLSTPYGRLIRDEKGKLTGVIESLDASPAQLKISEMNIGFYCVNGADLFRALKKISPANKKKEYYLTDIVQWIDPKTSFCIENPEEVLGINNRFELHRKERYLAKMTNKKWMLAGVTIKDSNTTYIDKRVKIGRDTILAPQTHLEGKTTIGSGCKIGVGAIIRDSRIGSNVEVKEYTIIENSRVENGAVLGPFARLRPDSVIKKNAKVGNFVELKKTVLGEGSKANHMTYLGDALIGKNVNVGCGVITCNYDGGLRYNGKATTKIGDHSFIGSDCQLIAPLDLKEGSYVASGTTVTDNAPADSLIIARAKQVTKKGYMKKLWRRSAKAKKGRK